MKIRWKELLLCEAVPLLTGGASALLTRGSVAKYPLLDRPPLSPPGWVFPVVWTALYAMMGLACYRVVTARTGRERVRRALWPYGAQLLVNFLWPTLFFTLDQYLFAFFWLLLLWALVLATAVRFGRISPAAGWLLLPYLAWVTFAGYLDLGVALLN